MSENPTSPDSSDSPDSSESAEPAEPLGDITRRIRAKRPSHAGGAQSDADDVGDENEREPGVGFDLETDTDGSDTRPGADSAAESRDLAADIDGDGDELFEEMDVSGIDTDEVWESVLTDEANDDSVTNASPTVDIDPTREVESTVGEDHIVPKDGYCESCRFFSTPPTVECSYEGSEIVEIVDSEQFRVRNCPVVAGTHNVYGDSLDAESDE
jgi:hypothetical protein